MAEFFGLKGLGDISICETWWWSRVSVRIRISLAMVSAILTPSPGFAGGGPDDRQGDNSFEGMGAVSSPAPDRRRSRSNQMEPRIRPAGRRIRITLKNVPPVTTLCIRAQRDHFRLVMVTIWHIHDHAHSCRCGWRADAWA